jgi:hypothetical protein
MASSRTKHQLITGSTAFRAPNGKRSTFRPYGPVRDRRGRVPNPVAWEAVDQDAARLFVGLNVNNTPTHTVEKVIDLVEMFQKRIGRAPDSSFVVQRGLFTQNEEDSDGKVIDKRLVREDSVQVIIIDMADNRINPRPSNDTLSFPFASEMIALAEFLCERLDQKEVILELQRGGRVIRTFGVARPARS